MDTGQLLLARPTSYDVADNDDEDYNDGDGTEDDEDNDDNYGNASFVVFRLAIKVNVWPIAEGTKECNWNDDAISFNRCNALIPIDIYVYGIGFQFDFPYNSDGFWRIKGFE